MDRAAPVRNRWLDAAALLAPFLLYIALVIPLGIQQRDEVNPDGIIYIRKAQFLLAGHFWDSVSGYWPPATSWCIALVLKFRPAANPLYVMHFVQEAWGALWVLGCSIFLAVMVPTKPIWRLAGSLAIVFAGIQLAVAWMAPDLLLGAMMMAYFALIARPDSDRKYSVTFLAGLCMGLGYLCKAYALPFFLLHFPMTLAYRWWTQRRHEPWTSQIRPLIIGGIAAAIFALPWIGLVSYKYHKFTISMVYAHNHINMAPDSYQRSSPDFTVVPPDPYLSIWEGLDPGPRKDWSAFHSAKLFRYQIHVAISHIGEILARTWLMDGGCIFLAIILTLLPWRRWLGGTGLSSEPMWITLTCVVYSFGFLVVAFETRYIIPVYLPLGLALVLRVLAELSAMEPVAVHSPWLGKLLAPLACAAFVGMAARSAWPYLTDRTPHIAHEYDKIVNTLRERNLVRLFTSTDLNKGVNLSWFLNQKTVLLPHACDDPKIVFKELADTGVEEILVWEDVRADTSTDDYKKVDRFTRMLERNPEWRRATRMHPDSARTVEVYVRKTSTTTQADHDSDSDVND